MYLLDTTTKQLKTFYGKEIPKYAILSHMWGTEEDEVLFRHIAGSDADRHEGKMRKGYAKLVGACKQAVEDGWEYIWIDTCCIDKSSSAELSEAINSMYEWYRNSGVCYVYLEDVRSDEDVQPESDENAMFPIVPFERSRWFSRGWTLQELIAPQYVVFYSKDWVDIGTKASLRDTISAVTRIRVETLTAYDPRKASVAEKMSWAAHRETKRIEDIAYCLMGLLGVNMPLLYGEGDRAFRRLQEEIMKVFDDDSLFAWKNGQGSARGMLATSPWDFRDGMNIVRGNDGAYAPYSMTNQGLQIKLPLLPIDPIRDPFDVPSKDIFKTILNCAIRDRKPTRRVVIYLRKIRPGHYQRICPHLLDETEENPNDTELTSLLVPQIDASTFHDIPKIRDIEIGILPTNSGFTTDNHSLVNGYKHYLKIRYDLNCGMIFFDCQGKRFGVVIGLDEGIPWLDFIEVSSNEWWRRSYDEGSQRKAQMRHSDRLSKKILGDWWVTVSVQRKMGRDQEDYCIQAIIDIQKVPIRARGWYIPFATLTHDDFSANFLSNLDLQNVHPGFKKEGHDWFAVFNTQVERVFDISLLYTFRHKPFVVDYVQFSRDGKYLAVGWDSTIRIYDIQSGAETCTFIDISPVIRGVCFSPNSKFLITGHADGCVKLWNIDENRIHKVFNGHQGPIKSFWFSFDAHHVISRSNNGTIRISKMVDRTSRILTTHSNYRTSVAISPDSRLVAVGNDTIRIWDIVTTRLLVELRGHKHSACIAFTADGKGLVSGSTDGVLRYWDVNRLISTGSEKKLEDLSKSGAPTWTLAERDTGWDAITFTGHERFVNSVSFSHDGRWIISGSRDDSIRFWDLKDATARFVLKLKSCLS